MAVLLASSPHPQAADSAHLTRLAFADLRGWQRDTHGQAFAAFLKTCEAMATNAPELRPARHIAPPLAAICRKAITLGPIDDQKAKAFFEAEFEPWLVANDGNSTGLLTGYYEPEFCGSLTPTAEYKVPLLARPDDLETIPEGETRHGIDPDLRGARRLEGGFTPYPTRAEIEDGALGDKAQPLVYLKWPSEAFIIQVQGSTRIRLDDGKVLRLAYAGRNGQPYTSIGRLLIERGAILPDEMSLQKLMGWLDANPEEARDIMRSNLSYIFFRIADELSPQDGPIGGAGTPLVPERSLAVDRRFWSYGLPFWLEGSMPLGTGGDQPLQKLMIAQDTGSAILGGARGDYFFGSGEKAGTLAGLMRHRVRFIVLQPRGWQPLLTGPKGVRP